MENLVIVLIIAIGFCTTTIYLGLFFLDLTLNKILNELKRKVK